MTPEFATNGELPLGEHPATLDLIEHRYATNPKRRPNTGEHEGLERACRAVVRRQPPHRPDMTIKNLHQRKITAARLDQFTTKLDQLEAAGDPSDVGRRLAIAQTRSYITEFETELAEFDALATTDEIPIEDLDHLGEALIRARVASGLTQAQLAERVGLKTAAINRYEANDYRSANLARLAQIAHAIDFNLNAVLHRQ